MQDFIVLGQIPGTNTYFNFSDWLFFCAAVISLYIVVKSWRRAQVRFLTWRVTRLIRNTDFAPFALLK